jgi:mono/diheme cytochrome c family protein
MSRNRHPSESWDRRPLARRLPKPIPAFAGMTALVLALAASVVMAQGMPKPTTSVDRPNATGGEKLYVEHCAMCHGPNGMGTGLLGRRVQPALLEQRNNLAAAYVITAARRGIGNMPAIPRGEVSDAELQQIADYLAAGPHGAAK